MGFYRLLGAQKPITFCRNRSFLLNEIAGFYLIENWLFRKPNEKWSRFEKNENRVKS